MLYRFFSVSFSVPKFRTFGFGTAKPVWNSHKRYKKFRLIPVRNLSRRRSLNQWFVVLFIYCFALALFNLQLSYSRSRVSTARWLGAFPPDRTSHPLTVFSGMKNICCTLNRVSLLETGCYTCRHVPIFQSERQLILNWLVQLLSNAPSCDRFFC